LVNITGYLLRKKRKALTCEVNLTAAVGTKIAMSKQFTDFLTELEGELDEINDRLKVVKSARRRPRRAPRRRFDGPGFSQSGIVIVERTTIPGGDIEDPVKFRTQTARGMSARRVRRPGGGKGDPGNYTSWPARQTAAARVITPQKLRMSLYMHERKILPMISGIPIKGGSPIKVCPPVGKPVA
jgi:hypothetical protein